jgi:hypothetical protein
MNTCKCRLCSIELRVRRIENKIATATLLLRLPLQALQHCEVF